MHQLPSAAAMMQAAEAATGLSNWGGDLFRKPLEVLIADLNTTAKLSEIGAQRAHRRLFDNLCTRLKVADDRARLPGIAKEKIERPIFVIGLPRAGTTFFHNLLSADPVNRSPLTWEIMYPSPPPEEETYDSDPRIAQASEAMAFEGFTAPDLLAIHPFDARRPEECNFFWELSFLTVNYSAWWEVPNYNALLYSTDFRAVYEEERQVLQALQSRRRRDRWVLKTPAHIAWMDQLIEVFPDALFVQCHRDPAKIIPSLSNNLTVWRRTFSDEVKPSDFGMMEHQAEGLRKLAAMRRRPGIEERFYDAHYLDVQKDPFAVLRGCYEKFGIAFTPQREATVRAWMDEDRASHAKGPKHAYGLSEFGLDLEKIDRVYADYYADFNVVKER
ncbi:MAG: sulfotransferase [Hyphomonadaceae bacterium]